MGNKEEFYSGGKAKEKYSRFLKDKKVAVVGPARSIKGSRQGEFIDSCDVVVRVNLGLNVQENLKGDIGSRMDILYSAMSRYYWETGVFSSKNLSKLKKKYDIKWIVNTGIRRATILRMLDDKIKSKVEVGLKLVSKKNIEYLKNVLDGKPTAGIIAIYDLLQYDISELHIMGFTFYNIMSENKERKDYYYENYSPRYTETVDNVYKHDLMGEVCLLHKMKRKDKRIKVDEVLLNIMASFDQ
jgi:hypothetical protein